RAPPPTRCSKARPPRRRPRACARTSSPRPRARSRRAAVRARRRRRRPPPRPKRLRLPRLRPPTPKPPRRPKHRPPTPPNNRRLTPMAEITASLVKELRERTGAGMMECKKALTENNGDIQAAEIGRGRAGKEGRG